MVGKTWTGESDEPGFKFWFPHCEPTAPHSSSSCQVSFLLTPLSLHPPESAFGLDDPFSWRWLQLLHGLTTHRIVWK